MHIIFQDDLERQNPSLYTIMKENTILGELKAKEYKCFEDIKHIRDDGSEFWSARELAVALDYTKWENFSKVIGRAMIASENSGHSISDDFPEVRKIVEAGATSKPKKGNIMLDE